MIDRIRKAQNDESGFTLIELLVVVIIIGILAAIAIPTFLAQRESSWQSAVESDLRNAATAMESYSADNGGSYPVAGDTTTDATDVLGEYGFNQSDGVTVDITSTDSNSYVLQGDHSEGDVPTLYMSSDSGTITETDPSA